MSVDAPSGKTSHPSGTCPGPSEPIQVIDLKTL